MSGTRNDRKNDKTNPNPNPNPNTDADRNPQSTPADPRSADATLHGSSDDTRRDATDATHHGEPGRDRDAGRNPDRAPNDGAMPAPGTPLGAPTDDPRWTAWALGADDALTDDDRTALAAAVAADPEAAREIDALHDLAAGLATAYHADREATAPSAALDPARRDALLAATVAHPTLRARIADRLRALRGALLPAPNGVAGPRAYAKLAAVALAFVLLVVPTTRWTAAWAGYQTRDLRWSIRTWFTGGRDTQVLDEVSDRSDISLLDPVPEPPSLGDYLRWNTADPRSLTAYDRLSPGESSAAVQRFYSDPREAPNVPSGGSANVFLPEWDEHEYQYQPPAPDSVEGVDEHEPDAPLLPDAQLADPSRRIVLNGRMRATVAEVAQAGDEIVDWVTRRGGFLESSRLNQSNEHGGATLVLRIPRTEFEALRRHVHDRAITVLFDESDRVDATARHADMRERLVSLRAAEAELRELMTVQQEAGKDTEDVLAIFNLMTEYREQIEGLEGQLSTLQEQATLSTLTVDLETERVQPTEEATSPSDRIGATVQAARVDLLNGMEFGLRVLLYVAIALLPPALLLLATLWLWMRAIHWIAARRPLRRPAA